MISPTLAAVFKNSYQYTKDNNNEIITIEHVFSFLLEDESIQEIFTKLDVDYKDLSKKMFKYLEKYKQESDEERAKQDPIESAVLAEVIENGLKQALNSSRPMIEVEDILFQIIELEETHCAYLMKEAGVNKLNLMEAISDVQRDYGEDMFPQMGAHTGTAKKPTKKQDTKSILINMSEAYKNSDVKEPIIGRDAELKRSIQILSRKKKSNPILVGEPGVGKTSIVDGLVQEIEEGRVPDNLKNAEVFALNIGTLTSGTKYRGDFEQKLENMLKELKEYENPILFIDEIHNMIGAGGTSSSSLDMSEMLKPALASGEIKCIGTTTYGEYKNSFQKNGAMNRRFSKIDVKEPNTEDSVKILEGIKPLYEKHHNVTYSHEIIERMVELSQKHLHDKFLPDSAIDLMDEVGSKKHQGADKKYAIKVKDIEDTISEIANIPSKNLHSEDKKMLKNLSKDLKKSIYGQDEVIDLVTQTILINKAGLSNPNKPISSFLFTGPTGVGKTELVKELASTLGIKFNRLDMSEYMEKHAISKLIGAAPGYVGYEEGGILIEMVKKNPHSIILFDEIEKAHPDIANVLLQILDAGSLTDNTGYKADFKNTIVVMTSNLGTKEAPKMGFGGDEDAISQKTDSAIKKYFAPEIRNRLDNIVEFKHLTEENILKIVEKNIAELQEQLNKSKVVIKFDAKAKKFIADAGYDKALGARPIAREFNKLVKPNITNELLFGEISKGGEVQVTVKDGALDFKFSKK